MIKVNLYPYIKKKKKDYFEFTIEKEFIIYAIILIILGTSILIVNIKMNNQVSRLTVLKKEKENQNRILLKRLKILNNYKSQIEILDKKIQVIKDIRTKQNLPVLYINELVTNFIKDKLWFSSLSLSHSNEIKISGVAFDNHVLAEYIQRLRKVKYYNQIELIKASKQNISGFGLIKFDFKIQAK